jgi:hypothetical protein
MTYPTGIPDDQVSTTTAAVLRAALNRLSKAPNGPLAAS